MILKHCLRNKIFIYFKDYTGNVKLNPFPRWNPAMEHMDQVNRFSGMSKGCLHPTPSQNEFGGAVGDL